MCTNMSTTASYSNQACGSSSHTRVKQNKVPTLKYIVTQSMERQSNPAVVVTDSSGESGPNDGNSGIGKRSRDHFRPSDRRSAQLVTMSEPNSGRSREHEKEPPEGSGDLKNGIVIAGGYLRRPSSEIDVRNLLSSAYEKGAEWLQAGAELAFNMFSTHDDIINSKMERVRRSQSNVQNHNLYYQQQLPAPAPATTMMTTTTTTQKHDEREIIVQNQVNYSLLKGRPTTQTLQSQRGVQTSAVLMAESTDDTAYYNGYCARVHGRGVALDTIYVNGSGPSRKTLEIRVRLQLPSSPMPGVYGQLIREYGGKDRQTLHLKYSHGPVDGSVDIVCPADTDAHKLISSIQDHYLLVTTRS